MAKGVYIGVNSVAKKAKKIYVGVNGVAKKVKKAYVGVAGVAKLWFSGGGELSYYGTAEDLGHLGWGFETVAIGDYGLFAGGRTYYDYDNYVTAYNKSLVRSAPTVLSKGRINVATTSVGDYGLFAGGNSSASTYESIVDAYNRSLTRSVASSLRAARTQLAATTVGSYALFGGGSTSTTSTSGGVMTITIYPYKYVEAYDSALTKSNATSFVNGAYNLAATTVGSYALFAGGSTGSTSSASCTTQVQAYDESLTRTSPTVLSLAREQLEATTVGDYAIFSGGSTNERNSPSTDVVDAYNSSLTRSLPSNLSLAVYQHAATTVGDYALFGGGYHRYTQGYYSVNSDYTDIMNVYDTSLTKTNSMVLSYARYWLGAVTVGDYALFAGGCYTQVMPNGNTSTMRSGTVDVYSV